MTTAIALVLLVVLAAAISGVMTFVLMIAWNAAMPALFGLPAVTFWQAFALSVVMTLLTSGIRAATK